MNIIPMGSNDQYTFQLLKKWFEQPLGQIILAQETALLIQLKDQYSDHCLELNSLGHRLDYHLHPIRVGLFDTDLISWPEALPIRTESVNALIGLHSLDFCISPYQVLRECERVLKPEGRLLIIGFNPISLRGLRRWWFGQYQLPWRANFISKTRLKDWLSLLNFELGETKMRLFRPPWQSWFIHY